jgi:hypothetical protein
MPFGEIIAVFSENYTKTVNIILNVKTRDENEVTTLLNLLKPKLVQILFKDSVRTSKRTPHFTITKINCLKLFKEIIAVYSENHAKPIKTKCSITDCHSRWFIYLPLRLKGLRVCMVLSRNAEYKKLSKLLTILL